MKHENESSLVCVDASLIVRTLVPGSYSAEALTLLQTWQEAKTRLIAPALLSFEVTSVLRRMAYLQAISPALGDEAFTQFQRLNIHFSTRRTISLLAWKLAKELNQPRAYDTSYLALAQLSRCDFWTADERLYNAVKDRIAFVKWIGNVDSLQVEARK